MRRKTKLRVTFSGRRLHRVGEGAPVDARLVAGQGMEGGLEGLVQLGEAADLDVAQADRAGQLRVEAVEGVEEAQSLAKLGAEGLGEGPRRGEKLEEAIARNDHADRLAQGANREEPGRLEEAGALPEVGARIDDVEPEGRLAALVYRLGRARDEHEYLTRLGVALADQVLARLEAPERGIGLERVDLGGFQVSEGHDRGEAPEILGHKA